MIIMLKAMLLSIIWTFSTMFYFMILDKEPTNKRILIALGPTAISVIVFLVTLVIIL